MQHTRKHGQKVEEVQHFEECAQHCTKWPCLGRSVFQRVSQKSASDEADKVDWEGHKDMQHTR